MLFPIGAAQFITTDYLLAACETLAMWAFVEARFGERAARQSRWWLASMWAGFALAFLDQGPAGAAAAAGGGRVRPGDARPRAPARCCNGRGLPLFVLVALPWYAAVMLRNPGLLDYFLGNEVVGRFATDDFARHGEWYGWIAIYVPTLLVGTLPWTPALLRWARALPASRPQLAQRAKVASAIARHCCWRCGCCCRCWCSACRARACRCTSCRCSCRWRCSPRGNACAEGKPLPRWRWLLLWAAFLLALQFAAARWPTHKDARAWTDAIHARAPGPISQVDFVDDMARYGLHLHLGARGGEAVAARHSRSRASIRNTTRSVADELARDFDPDALWITKQENWPAVRDAIAAHGYRCDRAGHAVPGTACCSGYVARLRVTSARLAGGQPRQSLRRAAGASSPRVRRCGRDCIASSSQRSDWQRASRPSGSLPRAVSPATNPSCSIAAVTAAAFSDCARRSRIVGLRRRLHRARPARRRSPFAKRSRLSGPSRDATALRPSRLRSASGSNRPHSACASAVVCAAACTAWNSRVHLRDPARAAAGRCRCGEHRRIEAQPPPSGCRQHAVSSSDTQQRADECVRCNMAVFAHAMSSGIQPNRPA